MTKKLIKQVKELKELPSKNSFSEKNVGKLHNESLDFVHQKLLDISKKRKPLSKNELADYVKQFSAEYLLHRNISYKKEEIISIYDKLGYTYKTQKDLTKTRKGKLYSNKVNDKKLISFLDELNELIEEEMTTRSFTISSNKLLQKYKDNPKQLNSILTAIVSLAKSSYGYWNDKQNIDKWRDPQINTGVAYGVWEGGGLDGPVKPVIKADIGGFVAGSTGGLVAGPMGWLAGGCIASPLASAWELLWWP